MSKLLQDQVQCRNLVARMKMLSPVDALSPAFQRTREVLGKPFRLGFFLKIAFVAALTQPNFYSVLISAPLQGVQGAGAAAMGHGRSAFPAENFYAAGINPVAGGVTFAVIAVCLLLAVGFWIVSGYLFSRLRFTLFDLVLFRHGRVRAAWAKYGQQTWRYFGLTLLVGLVFLILMAATTGPFLVHSLKSLAALGAQGPNANPFPVLAQLFPLLGIFLVVALVGMIVDAVLQDFLLPPMAVENASIEGSFGRFFALFRDDFGSFLGYLLLRFVVGLAISWVLGFAVILVLGVLVVGGVLLGLLLYHTMWSGGTGLQAAFIAIVAAMALIVGALYLVAMAAVYGTAAIFKQSYALFYFGSRYPALGNLVEPPQEPVIEPAETILPPMPPSQPPPPVW